MASVGIRSIWCPVWILLILATSSIGNAQVQYFPRVGGAPRNTLAWFETACPSGWSEYTQAAGQFLRGKVSTVGYSSGSPLSPGEKRAVYAHDHAVSDPGHTHTADLSHSHSYPALTTSAREQLPGGSESLCYVGGSTYNTSSTSPGASTSGVVVNITVNQTGSYDTQTPYIVLRLCRKN